MPTPECFERVKRYVSLCPGSVKINGYLGGGTDGDVWSTSRDTAVKVFKYEIGYANERDSYDRLARFGIGDQIAGFWVPSMLQAHDSLMVVEMDLMHAPPYVIDFANVRLNTSPNFDEDVLKQLEIDGLENFEHKLAGG